MQIWKHFCTVIQHKKYVCRGCFKVGLYRQGMFHDLSKFSPVEFMIGCKYFQGDLSPNNIERQRKGYSSAWLHHKGRNKHHMEYWLDYGLEKNGVVGAKMPVRYVVEMFIDRVSAAKVYWKKNYTDASPWMYYQQGKSHHILHPQTRKLLERLLYMLKKNGEDATYVYIREKVLIRAGKHS